MTSNSAETTDVKGGIVSKITSFITTKKGMYFVAAIVLIGAIYFYTRPAKKDNKPTQVVDNKQQNAQQQNNKQEQNQQNYQPPPGYVTIPVEMLEGLQQGQMYENVPEEEYEEQLNLQAQQGHPQQRQAQQGHPQQRQQPPRLRHNQQLDDDEEEEIREQNLSKQEMESIQAQLNAMQQQKASA